MAKITTDAQEAAAALRAGALVAFPTETVYGLGADAASDAAVAAIFAAKRRPRFNPLIAHAAAAGEAFALGRFGPHARRLAEAFWPGPLTLVVPRAPACPVSLLASAGLETIALRVPAHPKAQELLRAFGGPVVAPSANVSGRLSPTSARDVAESPLAGEVEVILDGGECAVGVESTIIGFSGAGAPVLLRPGGVTREEIGAVLGRPLQLREEGEGAPSSPGRLPSHYAPRARVRLNAAAPERGEAYLAFGPDAPAGARTLNLSPAGDLREAAANLFAFLRRLDETGAGRIAVAPIPAEGLGEAINDRLRRAAAPRPEDEER